MVSSVELFSQGQAAAAISQCEHVIYIWGSHESYRSKGVTLQIEDGQKYFSKLVFCLDGTHLASLCYEAIDVWKFADGAHIHPFPYQDPQNGLAISPNGSQLAGGGTRKVTLWDCIWR